MIRLNSIYIKNLKSFDNEGTGVTNFSNINVFIGRNNQGKSNLLLAIKLLDYFELSSFLGNIPDTQMRFNDSIIINSVLDISQIFFIHSREVLDKALIKLIPIEITYNFEIENKSHEYRIKIESIMHKDNNSYTYLDDNNIYRKCDFPVTLYLDGKEIEFDPNIFFSSKIICPISFQTLSETAYDIDAMKDKLMELRQVENSTIVDQLLETVGNLSSDLKKMRLTYLNPVIPHNSVGKNMSCK